MAVSFTLEGELDDADGLAVAASMLQAGAVAAQRAQDVPAECCVPYTAGEELAVGDAVVVRVEPQNLPADEEWLGASSLDLTAGGVQNPEDYEGQPTPSGTTAGAALTTPDVAQVTHPAALTANAVELDAAGQPWDVRIHVGSRARMKADDTWRLKPKVDPALVEEVRAENAALMAVPTPAADLNALAAAGTTPPPVPNAPPVPSAAPAGYVMPAVPTAAPDFYKAASQLHKDNVLSDVEITAVAAAHGVPSLAAITQRPDLIPVIWAAIVSKVQQ